MTTATVRISIVGGSRVLKQLQGITRGLDAAAGAERRLAGHAESAATRQVKAAEQTAKTKATAAERAEAAVKKSLRDEAREADKLAQHWRRIAEKSRAVRERAEKQATEAARREAAKQVRIAEQTEAHRRKLAQETLRRAGGVVGGTLAGALAGGTAAAGAARNVAGVEDVQTRVQKANDFERRLVVAATNAGLSEPETGAAKEKIVATGQKLGIDPTELLAGLETGQASFNEFRGFLKTLDELATISRATDARFADTVDAIGSVGQAFGLTSDQMIEAGNLMAAASSKGAIELKDFASNFAPVAGIFASNTGLKGIEGLREFLGVSQGVGTLKKRPAESATLVERFSAELANADTQKELREKAGVDIRGKSPIEAIELLAKSEKLKDPAIKQQIFENIVSREAVTALIDARERVVRGESEVDARTIAGAKASEGSGLIQELMRRVSQTDSFAMDQQAVAMQADTITHLKDYNAQILAVTKATNELEKRFGTLGMWASSIGLGGIVTGVVGGVVSSATGRLLGGAGGAAAGAGGAAAGGAAATGGSLLGTLGTGVSAAGAGTVAGAAALAGGAGAAVGYGVNKLSEVITEKTVSEHIVDWILPDAQTRMRQSVAERGDAPLPTIERPRAHVLPERPAGAHQESTPAPHVQGAQPVQMAEDGRLPPGADPRLRPVQRAAITASTAREEPTRPAEPARVDGEIVVRVSDDRTHVRVTKQPPRRSGGTNVSIKSGALRVGEGWGE